MQAKSLNGILVLFFPDRIFKRTIKENAVLKTLIRLALPMFFFTAAGVYLFKTTAVAAVVFHLKIVLLIILNLYIATIIISAAISFLLNFLYSVTIKINGKYPEAIFAQLFLCHLHTIPVWLFWLFLVIHTASSPIWVFITVFLVLRLLDIEARIIKIVYDLRLFQGYALVLIEALLILLGMSIGFFIMQIKS